MNEIFCRSDLQEPLIGVQEHYTQARAVAEQSKVCGDLLMRRQPLLL